MSIENNKYHSIELSKPFSELQRKLNRFNIFKATGIVHQEIKHTQFLGYLLDPNESHGLKDDFLFRFLQLASINSKNIVPLADFNLSYARIYKEKQVLDGRIDLLLEIPSIENTGKLHLFAIENKIKSLQGTTQLQDYRNAITNKLRNKDTTSISFLYLTVFGEQPNDQDWISATYSEIVLPAIDNILEESRETISDYMCYILRDYVDFIKQFQEQEPDNDLDSLIGDIPDEIINTARHLAKSNPSIFGLSSAMAIRYSKAIEYLKCYRKDRRTELLNYFNSDIFNKELEDKGFTREHSIRSHLRFSFLTKETAKKLVEYCQNPTENWLSSYRHLAIELVIQSKGSKALQCDVILTLGPTGAKHREERSELVAKLRAAAGYNRNLVSAPHFARITPANFSEFRSEPDADAKQWIFKTICTLKDQHGKQLKDIEDALNKFLDLKTI